MCNSNCYRECNNTSNCGGNCNCSCNNNFDDALFREVERIAHRAACRRAKENRCARQFINCMRSVENEYCGNNWNNGCGCNRF